MAGVDDPPAVRAEGIVLGQWLASDAARILETARDPDTRAWSPSMRALQTQTEPVVVR